MDKGLIVLVVAGCLGGGAYLGGHETASQNAHYNQVLSDPDFYYLVDESGNSVSELANKALR
jgi:hypothetical protein